MRFRLLTIYIILVIYCRHSYSQTELLHNHDHFLGYNAAISSIKEEILLPKVHRGILSNLTYRFEKNNAKYYSLKFDIAYGKLRTTMETEKVTWNGQINLRFTAAYKMIDFGSFRYSLGYTVDYEWSVMEYPVWDESRAYWSTTLSAGPCNRLMVTMKNNMSWIFTWDLCLLGVLSRPDEIRLYAQEKWTLLSIIKTTHSYLEPVSVNKLLKNAIGTEFRLPLKNGNYFSFCYSFRYLKSNRNSEPPVYINSNILGMGIGF